jgi:hypothetical protein
VDYIQGLDKFFSDNPPVFINDDTTKVRLNGKLYDYADQASLRKLFDADVVLQYNLNEFYRKPELEKLEVIKNYIESNFRQDVIFRKEQRERIEKISECSDLALPDMDYIIENIQPARIVGDTRREGGFCFIDRKTSEVTPYDYYAISFVLQRHLGEKTAARFMQQVAHVQPIYDPHGGKKLTLIPNSNNIYELNKYVKPSWMAIQSDTPAYVDEDIEKLIDHLFPEDRCKEFFYTWVYHSLTSRAGTYLYLCGGQGSGKNTIAELLSALHGFVNFAAPKQDSLKNRFNFYLKEKRFIFFDEFNCRKREDKDTLKSIINDRIQIEGKNRDHEQIDIHASFMIANNSLEAIGLEPVDRRFSVPNVNHESILYKYDRRWITNLCKKFSDDTILAAFANYVLEEFKNPKWYPEEPYQPERFEEIVIATARKGLSETLAKILKGEQSSYNYHEERERFVRVNRANVYFPPIQDWKKFLETVKVNGKPIGVVSGDKFIPNIEFMPMPSSRGDRV